MKERSLSEMIKNAAVLFVITLVAGVLLGFTYEITKEPILRQQEEAIYVACQEVFASADSFTEIAYTLPDVYMDQFEQDLVTIGKIFVALDGEQEELGYVVEVTTSAGYQSDIVIYVGVTNDGVLNAISILSIAETPGLGMRAQEVLVPQFHGAAQSYTLGEPTENQMHIDAITQATITTKAITTAVNDGLTAAALLRGDLEPHSGHLNHS
ncbi:MAG: FMN-binding protein [Lachnospiraceae bacterium]|jgi:electron transport complex protein RnfG|nr:FMN-binding protein [Lachnospiraceae bacterium]